MGNTTAAPLIEFRQILRFVLNRPELHIPRWHQHATPMNGVLPNFFGHARRLCRTCFARTRCWISEYKIDGSPCGDASNIHGRKYSTSTDVVRYQAGYSQSSDAVESENQVDADVSAPRSLGGYPLILQELDWGFLRSLLLLNSTAFSASNYWN